MSSTDAQRETPTVLVWRWGTVADPDAPGPKQVRNAPRIPSPLADRVGQRCILSAQSPTNGNRLVEFEDGFRVVAPLWATRTAEVTGDETLRLAQPEADRAAAEQIRGARRCRTSATPPRSTRAAGCCPRPSTRRSPSCSASCASGRRPPTGHTPQSPRRGSTDE